MPRSTRLVILIKNIYILCGRKHFLLSVTDFATNLVYPFTSNGYKNVKYKKIKIFILHFSEMVTFKKSYKIKARDFRKKIFILFNKLSFLYNVKLKTTFPSTGCAGLRLCL